MSASEAVLFDGSPFFTVCMDKDGVIQVCNEVVGGKPFVGMSCQELLGDTEAAKTAYAVMERCAARPHARHPWRFFGGDENTILSFYEEMVCIEGAHGQFFVNVGVIDAEIPGPAIIDKASQPVAARLTKWSQNPRYRKAALANYDAPFEVHVIGPGGEVVYRSVASQSALLDIEKARTHQGHGKSAWESKGVGCGGVLKYHNEAMRYQGYIVLARKAIDCRG